MGGHAHTTKRREPTKNKNKKMRMIDTWIGYVAPQGPSVLPIDRRSRKEALLSDLTIPHHCLFFSLSLAVQ